MLTLTEVEEWHYGCLFVLRWVSFEDFVYDFQVLVCEFERDGGVVDGAVSVLLDCLLGGLAWSLWAVRLTTESASLRRCEVVESGRSNFRTG